MALHQPRNKRTRDDDLAVEQPLAKRLEMLCIRLPTRPQKLSAQHNQRPEQRMDVDNVVYVDSLSDDESEDEGNEKLIFVPDIEKRLTKIPEHVLNAGTPAAADVKKTSTDLVLYSVPNSLTVEGGGVDIVRKGILESRARWRLKMEAEAAAAAESARLEGIQAAEMAVDCDVNRMGMGGQVMSNGVNNGPVNGMGEVPAPAAVYDPDDMEIE